jgi:drug/metabolite transporter (DMT)-like permease
MHPSQLLPDQTKTFTQQVILALLAVYIFWGSIYLAIEIALESYPPLLASGFRFLIGGGLMIAYLMVRREALPTMQQWRRAVSMGSIMIGVGMGGTAIAQQSITSSLAAIIAATIPAWVAVFIGIAGEWPQRREWVGIALGFCGIILINVNSLGSNSKLVGIGIMTLVAIEWAFGTSLKSRGKSGGTLADSTAEMLVGSVVLLAVSQISGERILTTPTLSATIALIYMGVFGSALVYVAYMYLVQTIRPAIATSNAYVNPAVAVLLGLTIGEVISFTTWIALGFILASVFVLLHEQQAKNSL